MPETHGNQTADRPLAFAQRVAADLRDLLGAGLAGGYLHGSAVLDE